MRRTPDTSGFTLQWLIGIPELRLSLAAGAAGLQNHIRWVATTEVSDPAPWIEGGELLLNTGGGIGTTAQEQRNYVTRLARSGLAGFGFGVGFGHDTIPEAVLAEADRLDFPVLEVPYEVPFIAITKVVFTAFADQRLQQLREALEVHEELAAAILKEDLGYGRILRMLAGHVRGSLALVDESGAMLAEAHDGPSRAFENPLQLPVQTRHGVATLLAVNDDGAFDEYDRVVLSHGQTALAFEMVRRQAVTDVELRLAGSLFRDLEEGRLQDGDATQRLRAFGLNPDSMFAALIGQAGEGAGDALRVALERRLRSHNIPHISTGEPNEAVFLIEANDDAAFRPFVERLALDVDNARIGVGSPARGRAIGHSLLEARAALMASYDRVAFRDDLGSLGLLLALPEPALESFIAQVLGPVAQNDVLLTSLSTLLEHGCRWGEAADALGIHRHTLRYRMAQVHDLTGRQPDHPGHRMDLWLAIRAKQAMDARRASLRVPSRLPGESGWA